MRKRDYFYSSGSLFGILSCVLKLIELLGKEGLATYVVIAIFMLLTVFFITFIGWVVLHINKTTIDSLKDTNKTIEEQLNQLIQSQNQHIKNQNDRFQKPEFQSSANNN